MRGFLAFGGCVDPGCFRHRSANKSGEIAADSGMIVTTTGRWPLTAMGGRRAVGASAIGLLLTVASALAAPAQQQEPTFISIGGGAVDSAAFRWSSALAQILSRPPGLPKCESGSPCGVPGVIAGAQTYDHPGALLGALTEGRVATGILSALEIFQARCDPPKGGQPAPIWILKALYRQPVRIVAISAKPIRSPKDLAGMTIALGERGTDSEIVGDALLEAYGPFRRHRPKIVRRAPAQAAAALKDGTVQAALFVGHAADAAIGALLASDRFALVPLPESPERQRLLRALPMFDPDTITADTDRSSPETPTLSQRAFWVAGPGLGPGFADKLVSDESDSRNAAHLAELVAPSVPVAAGDTFGRLPAPPAEGAERYAVTKHHPIDVISCPARAAAAASR